MDATTPRGAGDGTAHARGRDADSPAEIPARGWLDVAARVKDAVKRDRVPLASAGVAFYAMLALFPTLTAFLSLYGLVADPASAEQQVAAFASALPGGAEELVTAQVEAITAADPGALTLGAAISVLAALWTASSGMNGLMEALTLASGGTESRGFVRRRATALGLTLAAMLVVAAALVVIVVAPLALSAAGLGGAGEWLVRLVRWPLMAVVVIAALAMVYRYGPDRRRPQWQWVSAGPLAAALLWVLGSLGFSFYVANFGAYNEAYGALGAVIVLLLWLFVSSFVVLLGAEINTELERQTRVDTTVGDPAPTGQRDSAATDHAGERSH